MRKPKAKRSHNKLTINAPLFTVKYPSQSNLTNLQVTWLRNTRVHRQRPIFMNLLAGTQNLENHWLWRTVKSNNTHWEDHLMVYAFFSLVVLVLYAYSTCGLAREC